MCIYIQRVLVTIWRDSLLLHGVTYPVLCIACLLGSLVLANPIKESSCPTHMHNIIDSGSQLFKKKIIFTSPREAGIWLTSHEFSQSVHYSQPNYLASIILLNEE